MIHEKTIYRMVLVALWGGLAMVSMLADAQSTCPAGLPTTASDSQFEITGNGEVLHVASNLVFMRCSIGQQWDGSTCVGEPEPYDWQQTLALSVGYSFNDNNGWRLPNVKELSLIIERACVRPAVNETIFPNNPIGDYWTSSPSTQDGEGAWALGFDNGTNSVRNKQRDLFVRLVRNRTLN